MEKLEKQFQMIHLHAASNPEDSNPDHDSVVIGESETEEQLERPKLYKVLLHNDDYTTMEFVVMILVSVFRHDVEKASQIMMHVHQHGSGVAGIFPFEVAETKAQKVRELARENEFPLRCSVEEE